MNFFLFFGKSTCNYQNDGGSCSNPGSETAKEAFTSKGEHTRVLERGAPPKNEGAHHPPNGEPLYRVWDECFFVPLPQSGAGPENKRKHPRICEYPRTKRAPSEEGLTLLLILNASRTTLNHRVVCCNAKLQHDIGDLKHENRLIIQQLQDDAQHGIHRRIPRVQRHAESFGGPHHLREAT